MKTGLAALLLALLCACTPKIPADQMIMGGTVHTGVDKAPMAETVLIQGGRILFVGSKRDAKKYAPQEIIDLNGAHLYPGFTDAHAHLYAIGEREVTLNLEGIPSLAAMLEAVRQEVAAKPDGVIVGRGWIETHWPEKRFPNRFDLDRVAPGRVVLLERADGHALVASSQALEIAGVNPDTIDPDGGRIERDGEGAPSGMLIDYAMSLVLPLLEAPSKDLRNEVMIKGAQVMAEYGWTGTHNMSVPEMDVVLLEALATNNELPIRVYNGIDQAAINLLDDGPRFVADNRVITRAIKIYMDGALGSRGAALLAPYADSPEHSGLALTSYEQTMPLLREALQSGWQMQVHAIGDRGNREVLNWMEEVFAEIPVDARKVADPRWRIEHSQIIAPVDIPRFAKLGVLPSMQPSHAIGDLYFAPDRLGPKRMDGAYAWQSLVNAGSIVVGGSDAPVERGDPRIEFYAAIARKGLDGYSDENWHQEEALSRENALKMFTLWPAIASFQEADLGTVEVGKRADFTVFDRDILTVPAEDILTAKVMWTIVDGAVAYAAK